MNTQDLKQHFGTQVAVARFLNIHPVSVNEWFLKGRIPYLRQLQLQMLTYGKLQADSAPTTGRSAIPESSNAEAAV